MDWPLYYADQLALFNESSPIALCTLWTKKEEYLPFVKKEKLALVANLYTVDGISYIIMNVLAKPTIKHIILVGHDLTGSGEALVRLVERGIDERGNVPGLRAYVHPSISKDDVEVFRKSVHIYDLRGALPKDFAKINSLIDSIKDDAKPFCEPRIIRERPYASESLGAEEAGHIIRGRSLAEVWIRLLDAVMKFGEVKMSEYNVEQKELLDTVSVVMGDGPIPPSLPFGEQELKAYSEKFFTREKPDGVDYTYGNRLFAYARNGVQSKSNEELIEVIDQISAAEEKLKAHPYTRRAVAITWRPEIDITSSNPPCLMEISWNVKFGKLYQTATFRSHDVFGAWLLNAYALRNLQKKVASDLGIPHGDLVIISISAHIYKNNWAQAREVIEKNKFSYRLELDPKGYFLIEVDIPRSVIRARHKLNDGRDSGYVFEGKSPEEIYKRIVNEGLISYLDHAAYIGKELQRAEEALREKKPFVQDSS
ncbi:MAG: thymidylate synthase [Thermoprotei archaeon]